jgi:predicted nucleic acid-binding protein
MVFERAKTDSQRLRRESFLRELRAAMTVHPFTGDIAQRAGAISGRHALHGVSVRLADLMIRATALYHGCDAVTQNAKHFKMIPGLVVKELGR